MKKVFLLFIFFSSLVLAENVKFYKPSFDCSNVKKNSIEYMICTDEELSILDKKLGKKYKRIVDNNDIGKTEKINIKQKQRHWLKNVRNGCNNMPCLKYVYMKRNAELKILIYEYSSEFSKLEAKIENDEYKKCMINSGGGSMTKVCTSVVIKKWEKEIKSIDKKILYLIKNNKKGVFQEFPLYYKKNDISKLRITLKNIFLKNIEDWEKYKLTYNDFINNTYGYLDGTMWKSIGDLNKIGFLKSRVKIILHIKNKIR